MTVAVVLAASGSPEGPPALFPFKSNTLLGSHLEIVDGWPVAERLVVLGSQADKVLDLVAIEHPVVIDYDWADGDGSPLRVALDYLSAQRRHGPVVVTDVRQPAAQTDLIDRLLEACRPAPGIAVSLYRYEVGLPVAIDRSRWEAFMARDLPPLDVVSTHGEWVTEVRLDARPPQRIRSAADVGSVDS